MYFCNDKNGVKHFSNTMPSPEYLHGATESGGVQYCEVTPKEIETFGNELLGKRVEMACKFSGVSDTWVRILLGDNRFVGFHVRDKLFQFVFANKEKCGRALLHLKSGDRLRLIGKVQRVQGTYVFMVEEIRR
ncbi:MAG: hypothetical protein JRE23_18150 [Deltaproteobacteria bacterium]|nr:hypothetical protein [Deltaproteobacteria bacterium]